MYNVDTEHVNGEGYYNPAAIEEEHMRGLGLIVWISVAFMVAISIFVGYMLAVWIGGF